MITNLLYSSEICRAFDMLEKAFHEYPGEGYMERLEDLRTEFGYMRDYMLKGYKDEKRGELFQDLLQRMEALDYDFEIRRTLKLDPMLRLIGKQGGDAYVTAADALNGMENAANEKAFFLANEFSFYSLLTSGWWTAKDAEEWSAVLLTIDSLYAAPLVAALGLSAMTNLCLNKVRCLSKIYRMSTDEKLRQRALVCAVIALCRIENDDKEPEDCEDEPEELRQERLKVLQEIMEVPGTASEIINMQIQLIACANAQTDAEEINNKIMPDLVKNQPFRLTKDGFVEKDEEKDCLDTNADERMMDAVKSGVDKMVGMQKNGSDIFFSGFSAMKRFPFFVSLRNWFMPFTITHPAIAEDMKLLGNSAFVKRMMEGGPFCDSDKYSFVLGYSSVYKHMPDEVKKLVESGEVGPIGMDISKTQPTSAFVRLQFLQDMYRFFMLNTVGQKLYNPFVFAHRYCPWMGASKFFTDEERKTMVTFMLHDEEIMNSHRDLDLLPLTTIIDSFEDKKGYWASRYRAELDVHNEDYSDAIDEYTQCLKHKPEDPVAMRGMARVCYATGEYAKAAFYFDAMHTLFPNRRSYVLNYAISMVKDGMAEGVVNDVYKLYYENPDDVNICNTLGWVLLYAGKAEQAVSIYDKLISDDKYISDYNIVMNAVYTYLVTNRAQRAIDVMQRYFETLTDDEKYELIVHVNDSMDEEDVMLKRYGIGRAEKSVFFEPFIL